MKQYNSGNFGRKIGGIIATFSGSLVILAPFSFIGIMSLVFDEHIQQWMSLNTFILIGGAFFICYEWFYFAFIYPAITNYSNKQSFIHGNPIKDELKTVKDELKDIKDELRTIKDELKTANRI